MVLASLHFNRMTLPYWLRAYGIAATSVRVQTSCLFTRASRIINYP